MDNRIRAFLWDALEAADEALGFVGDSTLEIYFRTPLLQAGVERKLMIVGEALRRVRTESPETLQRIAGYNQIIGLRNTLSHDYDKIDSETLWDIVSNELPELKKQLASLLDEDED